MNRSTSLIYCHPYAARSRAGRTLLEAVRDVASLDVRPLYSLYPDFDIDVEAEQRALLDAELIVWQGPLYWYGLPALMNLWFEKVLTQGWAYGDGARALRGKRVLWVATTGAPATAYQPGAMHGHVFDTFAAAISQTARFCGMRWMEPPLIVHGAHRITSAELREAADGYRQRLQELARDEDSRISHA